MKNVLAKGTSDQGWWREEAHALGGLEWDADAWIQSDAEARGESDACQVS